MHSVPDHPAVFNSTVDRERKRIRTEILGRIGLAQVEEYIARKVKEDTMPFADLIDARHASTGISAHDIPHLVGILKRIAGGAQLGPVAMVVADSVTYGMTRMMAALIEGTVSIHPFRDVEKAEEWLGWEPD